MRTNNLRKLGIILPVALGILFLAQGCGSKNKSTNPSPEPQPSHLVTISNFAFSPTPFAVAMGDTVTWRNNDSAPHTVTSDSGTELQSPSIGQGGTYTHIFAAAGSYSYHCTIHTSMPHATVTVQ
jgi:plastocyanin